MTKRHTQETESETPAPVVHKGEPIRKNIGPRLGQRIRYRDENGVVSVADVVGHADDGTLFMHVLYRDGIAGAFNRSFVAESVDGGAGWFFPAEDE